MRHIKLRKIVRKQKAIEQAKKNATEQGNSIIYFGLDTYNEINKMLKIQTNKRG